MKLKKKRNIIFICTICLLMLVTLFSSGCAVDSTEDEILIPDVQKDVYVYDQDNIINDETEQKLNKLLIQLESKTTAEVAVITVPSLLDMEIEDYSYELANTLGIGKAEEDNGVLLLISRNDTRVRLEIGKGLEGCLNDSKCGRILDDYFVPYREKDEYSEGTYQTIQAVTSVIAKEYDTSLEGLQKDYAQEIQEKEEKDAENALRAIIIIIVIIIILIVCDRIFLDGAILSGIISSFDDDDFGGFGGGFGGGSGGGFGGGSFGGGGASR